MNLDEIEYWILNYAERVPADNFTGKSTTVFYVTEGNWQAFLDSNYGEMPIGNGIVRHVTFKYQEDEDGECLMWPEKIVRDEPCPNAS